MRDSLGPDGITPARRLMGVMLATVATITVIVGKTLGPDTDHMHAVPQSRRW